MPDRPADRPSDRRFEAYDQLAIMVAAVQAEGRCLFANAAFEHSVGVSRRSALRRPWFDWFLESGLIAETVAAVARNEFATSRLDATLLRPSAVPPEPLHVHLIVSQLEGGGGLVLFEMLEIEQQARLDREERVIEQVEANRELVRNLAHEIKNPLGGIRGAAQLLQMEIEAKRELTEYTQVIIHEADRLQALVDRLLAPHRQPTLLGEVNIHEVIERVRAVVVAEFPRGLALERDYDTSIPTFQGDREQLIQAVLNIVQNAALALAERRAAGDARIVLRTRIARQVTIGKQRWRLALELHIEDNGPGVPEALRDRIFYPLVSGREGGSGLGLTLAQSIIARHHGMIDCESEPGRTLFRLTLPLP